MIIIWIVLVAVIMLLFTKQLKYVKVREIASSEKKCQVYLFFNPRLIRFGNGRDGGEADDHQN